MLNKAVGETPLSCAEAFRAQHSELEGVPMAYAGRLDPMASGKLLVLLGEECKNQTAYHGLDKEYEFSVLLGIGSDSHDVLGRLTVQPTSPTMLPPDCALRAARPSLTQSGGTSSAPLNVTTQEQADSLCVGLQSVPVKGKTGPSGPERPEQGLAEVRSQLNQICTDLTGNIELPYPNFSAKTVQGKPLHMWTLENRLHEIEIPTKQSIIYSLKLDSIETKSRTEICTLARKKIDSIPEVTEARKALGNDFRRVDVRQDWENIKNNDSLPERYLIAHFTCVASSGTYMRTLAHLIGQNLTPATPSLAWSIHRTKIGTYDPKQEQWKHQF